VGKKMPGMYPNSVEVTIAHTSPDGDEVVLVKCLGYDAAMLWVEGEQTPLATGVLRSIMHLDAINLLKLGTALIKLGVTMQESRVTEEAQ